MPENKVVVQFVGRDAGVKASAEALASTLNLIEGLTADLTKEQKKLNTEAAKGAAVTKTQVAAAKDLQSVAAAGLKTNPQRGDGAAL